MRLDRRSDPDSAIPTSSMADIAFLLIIFFMVTSVFSATKGLDLRLPTEAVPPDPKPDPAVLIHVRADGVLVDCRPMAVAEILPYLEPRLSRNPTKPVILYTSSDAEYRAMVAVYDALSRAGRADGERSFALPNVQVPTRREIEEYEALFGENPFETACGG